MSPPLSLFDTALVGIVSSGEPEPDFFDNFEDYPGFAEGDAAWPTTDISTVRVEPTPNEIRLDIVSNLSNDAIARDLGAGNVSDTVWTYRIKINISLLNAGGTTIDKRLYAGIFDSDQTIAANALQDSIFMMMIYDSTVKNWQIKDTNNQQPRLVGSAGTFAHAPAIELLYLDIRRISSTTYSATIYQDEFVTPTETENGVVASGSNGYRYLKYMNDAGFNGAGQLDFQVDYVKFWDGINL